MRASKFLIFFGGFFAFGIVLGEFFSLRIFGIFSLAIFVIFYWFEFSYKQILILFLIFFFGFLRLQIAFDHKELNQYLGDGDFEGCVEDLYKINDYDAKYIFELSDFDEKVLLYANLYPLYRYGDCLKVRGDLRLPDKLENFDYEGYLSKFGISFVLKSLKIVKIGEERGVFLGLLDNVRNDFQIRLRQVFLEPYGGLMAGLILGSRDDLSLDLMEKFNITGLTHIIAISGYNITLLIVIVSSILNFLSRKVKVIACVFFIVVFVIFVGASASVVRAGIMGIIGVLAIWFGRNYYALNALLISGFLMILYNPKVLIYDLGFQLSFLATLGLILFSPILEKYLKFLPNFLQIRETFLMTISAQILTLPLILLHFQRFSFISPVANVFVLPFVPFAMLFGFLAVVFNYFSDFLSFLFGFVGYLILRILLILIDFFAGLEIFYFNFA